MYARLDESVVSISEDGVVLEFKYNQQEPIIIELMIDDASALRETLNKAIGTWKGSKHFAEELTIVTKTNYVPKKTHEEAV